MKKLLSLSIMTLLSIPFMASAQWLPSGASSGPIYYNGGNVGIGQTPVSPLTIGGYTTTMRSTVGITLGTGQNNIEFLNSLYGNGFGAKIYGIDSGNGNTTLRIATRGNTTVWKDALAITASTTGNGKVGIGTTTPSGILAIGDQSRSISPTGITLGIDQSNIEFVGSTSDSGYGHKLYAVDPQNGAVDLRVAVRQGTLSWTDALTIRSNTGNVGIGTTIPDTKLAVNGKIHANEVKVDLSVPGPDYVFNPGYRLPTLDEIKAYVEKNRHLPEIRSADEMAEKGIDLGDMNIKLLKKVEELTLYLLQKDAQLKAQDERLQKLEAKLAGIK